MSFLFLSGRTRSWGVHGGPSASEDLEGALCQHHLIIGAEGCYSHHVGSSCLLLWHFNGDEQESHCVTRFSLEWWQDIRNPYFLVGSIPTLYSENWLVLSVG